MPIPRLPNAFDQSSHLLTTSKGQLIQILKDDTGGDWKLGSVLYDPTPAPPSQKKLIPTTGWFPVCATEGVDDGAIRKLVDSLKITSSVQATEVFKPPKEWIVGPFSQEREDVFSTIRQQFEGYEIHIRLIRNMPLWRSYCIHKRTLELQTSGDSSKIWSEHSLFHGASPTSFGGIIGNGFTRKPMEFIQFHKCALKSLNQSEQDEKNGFRRIFLCRVLVNHNDQDSDPIQVCCESIIYPEYLITLNDPKVKETASSHDFQEHAERSLTDFDDETLSERLLAY